MAAPHEWLPVDGFSSDRCLLFGRTRRTQRHECQCVQGGTRCARPPVGAVSDQAVPRRLSVRALRPSRGAPTIERASTQRRRACALVFGCPHTPPPTGRLEPARRACVWALPSTAASGHGEARRFAPHGQRHVHSVSGASPSMNALTSSLDAHRVHSLLPRESCRSNGSPQAHRSSSGMSGLASNDILVS